MLHVSTYGNFLTDDMLYMLVYVNDLRLNTNDNVTSPLSSNFCNILHSNLVLIALIGAIIILDSLSFLLYDDCIIFN